MYKLLIFLFFLFNCGTTDLRTAKVIEPQGLILRDSPSMEGKQLALMKEKEEVIVLNDNGPEETLFGQKSRWFEVEYKTQKGWAFGGFLEYTSKKLPKTFTNSIGMQFVLIPAGEFMMGCVEGDKQCEDQEKPLHKVKITKLFYMGKYEVTQGEYKKIMGKNPSKFQNCGDNCPVEKVSWNDAKAFIEKLNKKEGKNYRLPTEAEWEYAARGSTTLTNQTSIYYWGNEMNGDYAWYNENSYVNYQGGYEADWTKGRTVGTHPVGQKKSNAFGLYDMSGNVWEWVEDRYNVYYYSKSPTNDPKGPSSGYTKVVRGGSWNYNSRLVRSSVRFGNLPSGGDYDKGFRLVAEY